MGEEAMVKEMLTRQMIEAGTKLIHFLDRAHVVVTASLWLYKPESTIWRLIIASPEVEANGPKKVYQKIQTILSKMREKHPGVGLRDISVVESDDPIILLLRVAIKTGGGISGIRFSKNTINGHFIEDAYIYRMT